MLLRCCCCCLLLQRKGVSGYILDLRDNPGGLVKAGLDIARMLLAGHPTVFSIVGRAGEPEQRVSKADSRMTAYALGQAQAWDALSIHAKFTPHTACDSITVQQRALL